MKINSVHCLFEQSGTFKKEFAKFGIAAYDYDICDDFKQTDFRINLFEHIGYAFTGKPSIFDKFKTGDLLMAFFPCLRFEDQIILNIRGCSFGYSKWSDEKKLLNSMRLMDEVNEYYRLICELVIICIRRQLRIIIENPYSVQHFLVRYFPLQAAVIDKDRSLFGDYFKKPTQYFFVNCVPENNITFGANFRLAAPKKKVKYCHGFDRSLISPEYAYNFIRDFIITDSYINKQ